MVTAWRTHGWRATSVVRPGGSGGGMVVASRMLRVVARSSVSHAIGMRCWQSHSWDGMLVILAGAMRGWSTGYCYYLRRLGGQCG